jgi:hypothetical protein
VYAEDFGGTGDVSDVASETRAARLINEDMMKFVYILVLGLVLAESSEAAWLLWRHTFMTRKLQTAPANALPQVTVDDWELLNALDARSECLSSLRDVFKRSYESLSTTYTGSKVNQSPLADGVSASLWTGADTIHKPTNEPMRIGVQYDFWCLPAGVDPKSTRVGRESN